MWQGTCEIVMTVMICLTPSTDSYRGCAYDVKYRKYGRLLKCIQQKHGHILPLLFASYRNQINTTKGLMTIMCIVTE